MKKYKNTKSLRIPSGTTVAMMTRHPRSRPMADRREPRGGSKNKQHEILKDEG